MKADDTIKVLDKDDEGRFSNMQRVTSMGDHYLIEFLARNPEHAVCVSKIYIPHSAMGELVKMLNKHHTEKYDPEAHSGMYP